MNKTKALILTLDADYSPEDTQSIANACMMIRGVISADTVPVTPDDHTNRVRIAHDIYMRLFSLLQAEMGEKEE